MSHATKERAVAMSCFPHSPPAFAPSFGSSSCGEYAGDVGLYDGDVGLYDGDVGLYDGDVGEYDCAQKHTANERPSPNRNRANRALTGDVGLYDGEVGLYDGEVGLYDGEVGE